MKLLWSFFLIRLASLNKLICIVAGVCRGRKKRVGESEGKGKGWGEWKMITRGNNSVSLRVLNWGLVLIKRISVPSPPSMCSGAGFSCGSRTPTRLIWCFVVILQWNISLDQLWWGKVGLYFRWARPLYYSRSTVFLESIPYNNLINLGHGFSFFFWPQ